MSSIEAAHQSIFQGNSIHGDDHLVPGPRGASRISAKPVFILAGEEKFLRTAQANRFSSTDI